MKEVFTISYPTSKAGKKQWAKEYGMNKYYAGVHWSVRKRDAEYWHAITRAAMSQQHIRKQPFRKPVVITFWWNDRLDIDNHAVMGKYIVDAMKGRIIEDDSRRYLKGVGHLFHDDDYIKIEICEVTE